MTQPASQLTSIGDIIAANGFTFESRPASCPSCGGPSTERRVAPAATLSDAVRARLDAERPFRPQHCDRCIDAREAADRAAKIEAKRAEALAALDVPALYADVSLDTFEVAGEDRAKLTRALEYGHSFVARWPDVPLISVFAGGCGTGKGHLLWSIAKELASSVAARVRVTVLSDTIRDLREAWNASDGPSEAERLRKYRTADLLAIDEVSRHAFFGQPQQHLYDLVAWREVRMKPTILTTNELGDDLTAVLGPALSSRAAGADGFVHFGTRDWRIANKRRRSA